MIRRVVVTATTRLPRARLGRRARRFTESFLVVVRRHEFVPERAYDALALVHRGLAQRVVRAAPGEALRDVRAHHLALAVRPVAVVAPGAGSVVRSWRSARFRKLVFTTAMTPLFPVSPKRSMYGPYTAALRRAARTQRRARPGTGGNAASLGRAPRATAATERRARRQGRVRPAGLCAEPDPTIAAVAPSATASAHALHRHGGVPRRHRHQGASRPRARLTRAEVSVGDEGTTIEKKKAKTRRHARYVMFSVFIGRRCAQRRYRLGRHSRNLSFSSHGRLRRLSTIGWERQRV